MSVRELSLLSPRQPVFIRPDADSKAFEGGVRSAPALRELCDRLPPDLEVMVGSEARVDAEYRVFIVGAEVIAASEYRRHGRPSFDGFVNNDVVDFAIEADRIWRPFDSYVLDIARFGGRLGIVEANCITAARYYGADPKAIVTALCRRYGPT